MIAFTRAYLQLINCLSSLVIDSFLFAKIKSFIKHKNIQKINLYLTKKTIQIIRYVRQNPHMGLAVLLFMVGSIFLSTKFSIISGALFGAGASLLGAWVTEINHQRSRVENRKQRETEARRYLTPELQRIIERLLHIHRRAVSNFSSASSNSETKSTDLQKDFIPYMPILYTNVPQFQDLPLDYAAALNDFYDSLHRLNDFVNDHWNRPSQLPVNIFNLILTYADESIVLAEFCIQKFDLETLYPPKYESWGTLSSRILVSKENARRVREHHIMKAETEKLKTKKTTLKIN